MKMVIFEKWFINSGKHSDKVKKRAQKLLQFVDIKENQSYLEVGCGNGGVCRYIAENYPLNVTGVDVDLKQIQVAQENSQGVRNIRFMTADATHLPFPDKEFDIVLSFGTTHHISNWLGALREMRRVLKSGGYFIYYDLVYSGFLAKLGSSFKHSYGIITMPELSEFSSANNYSEVHSSTKNSFIWYDYQVVYRCG
jgi:ubiquinone/menaquinone biosynthesis C-methylase UbiE